MDFAQNLAKITIFGFQCLVSGTKAILLHNTDGRKSVIHGNKEQHHEIDLWMLLFTGLRCIYLPLQVES
jgi:hypothetical protein